MNQYILTMILKSDMEDQAREKLLSTVTKNFDEMMQEDKWGNRDLAYPIKHQNKGWYVKYNFEAKPQQIPLLDKLLKLEEDILRYLLIRI